MTKLYASLIFAGLAFLFILAVGQSLQAWGESSIESYQDKQREQIEEIYNF
jgi:hypothetical protein